MAPFRSRRQWIHILLPALLAALRTLGDAPARSLTTLAQRLGDSEADTATAVAPLQEAAAPEVVAPVTAPVSPQADPVFDDVAALDTAIDVLDA